MSLAHRPFRVLKNLDDFHDWPVKYRHWQIEIAESDEHEIWVRTDGLRHIYPLLAVDEELKQRFHSSMFYVKDVKRHYISERAMRLALERARRGVHEAEVLRFLDWFGRNVGEVAAKKRKNAQLERINEIRDEHAPRIMQGPIGRHQAPPDLEASTLALSERERWASQAQPGEPARAFRPELVEPRLGWTDWAKGRVRATLYGLVSFWRGERNLFLTVGLAVLLVIAQYWIAGWLAPADIDPTREYARILWAHLFSMALAVPVSIWIAVSLTRSAWRCLSLPGGKLWATTVWLFCIPIVPVAGFSQYDQDQLSQWWDMVRGKYQPALVYADKELGRIVIKGEFKFGSAEALEAVLKANPRYTLVEIDSPGGYVLEGFRMAGILMNRKVDTVAMSICASSCTFLLAAGQERYIGPEALVGFHRSGSRYLPTTNVWSWTDLQMARYYASRGASKAFILKALAKPITGIWIAPHAEMYAEGYATAPWADRKAGY